MAETLQQDANGRWKLTIRHESIAGLEIPAVFTYNGSPVSFNITNSEQTINTEWETPLGSGLSIVNMVNGVSYPDDVKRVYSQVHHTDGKTYIVKNENFSVQPYNSSGSGATSTLVLSWSSKNVSSGASTTGTLLHLSSNTSWTIALRY